MKIEQLVSAHLATEVNEFFKSSDQLSTFENYGDFQVFVIRRMSVASKELGFQSEGFLIKGSDVYQYNRDSISFRQLSHGFQSLIELLEQFYHQNQLLMNSYSSEIERLENFLFNRSIPGYFMDLWFDIKKDLARVENFYFRNAVVYREFQRKMEDRFGEWHDEFKDIDENIQFQSTALQTMKGRLESLHNYYESVKNDRLNKTLLTLTIISGVFLPLNLIVGFFGMNTEGLYFHGDPSGTQKVLITLGLVLLVCLLGGKIIQLIDAFILKYILGRYNFYQNILKRVAELDQRLKGQ